ncbi:hypothetical protein AAMO2058_000117500 [Amorphochlora amoebiformis]
MSMRTDTSAATPPQGGPGSCHAIKYPVSNNARQTRQLPNPIKPNRTQFPWHPRNEDTHIPSKEEGDGKQEKKSGYRPRYAFSRMELTMPSCRVSPPLILADENAGFSGWGTFRSMMLGYYAGGKRGRKRKCPPSRYHSRLQDRTMVC